MDHSRERQEARNLARSERGSAHGRRSARSLQGMARMTHRKDREIPTLFEVRRAHRRIAPYLHVTPLHNYPSLDRLVGAEIHVKHENHQPTGAFKVRGGINLISQLTEEEAGHGVIAASTGNHGQSIAYAARLFGVQAVIC